jgi:hypothetical protein
MYCPGCSSPSAEGAKFCKTCGMNLTVVTQALVGSVVVSDPLRDREYKRSRKSISDGIQGSAIGAALMVAAALSYWLLPRDKFFYGASLAIGLLGIVHFFRSVGRIIDAKIGPKLLDPALQPRSTGPLVEPGSTSSLRLSGNPSRRLPSDPIAAPPGSQESSRTSNLETGPPPDKAPGRGAARPLPPLGPARAATGRVNREHSTMLRSPDKQDDILSKIRN